jgi:hypothetical protein
VSASPPSGHAQDGENSWANRPPSVDATVVQHVKFFA